ncbi:hypothetical protein MP638_000427 [Amoeboaphelidium occidentale]|nr:hypothetical protein MP638_000427 [Amoeboaphelidium occidentale]
MPRITLSSQVYALLKKNFDLQLQQWQTTLCQMLVPVLLLSLIGVFQVIIDNNYEYYNSIYDYRVYGRVPLHYYYPLPSMNGTGLEYSKYTGMPIFRYATASATSEVEKLVGHNCQNFLLCDEYQMDGFLGSFQFPNQLPIFLQNDTVKELDSTIQKGEEFWQQYLHDTKIFLDPSRVKVDLNATKEMIQKWVQQKDYTNATVLGAFIFNSLKSSAQDSTINGGDVTIMPAGRYGGWLVYPYYTNVSKLQALYPEVDRKGNMLNVLSNMYMKSLYGGEGESEGEDFADIPVIRTYLSGFPQKEILKVDLASITNVYLLGFATSFLLPALISNIVIDKHSKMLLTMQMAGLQQSVYFLCTYVYNFLTYTLIAAVMWFCAVMFQMRLFTQTHFLVLLAILLVWGHCVCCLAFFFAGLFSSPRTATFISYLLVITGVIISNLLNGTVYLAELPPLWYFLYPPFAFYRSIFIMGDACVRLQCLDMRVFQIDGGGGGGGGGDSSESVSDVQRQFVWILGSEVVMSFVYLGIGWMLAAEMDYKRLFKKYFNRVFRSGQRVRLPNGDGSLYSADDAEEEVGLLTYSTTNSRDFMDADVLKEKESVLEDSADYSNKCLVINGLKKKYDDGNLAVDEIYLALEKGECFGLLGANGAGKTTLISMLTGMNTPSSGTAWFSGGRFDLRKDLNAIRARIGVCMQFDVFYPTLTVEQHIYFYARLKGYTEDLDKEVADIIESVGLTMMKDRKAGKLSGGMRRRLSMGIAMVGKPDLLIMDEPSTGLDPLTKRKVWEIFTKTRERRVAEGNPMTVILTTHYMEEADSMCDRIGIMASGRMLCLGTSEYLKNKFSCGMTLSIQIEAADMTLQLMELRSVLSDGASGSGEKKTLFSFVKSLFTQDFSTSLVAQQELDEYDVDYWNGRKVFGFYTVNGINVKFLADHSLPYLFSFQIQLEEPEKVNQTLLLKNMFSAFSAAKYTKRSYLVPKHETASRSDLLQNFRPVVVKDWGIDRTTMEDVFLKVLKLDRVARHDH